MLSDRTRTTIIAVVTAVWAANFAAGLFLPDYQPDQAINAIFMAIVGGLFAVGSRERAERKDDDKSARNGNETPAAG